MAIVRVVAYVVVQVVVDVVVHVVVNVAANVLVNVVVHVLVHVGVEVPCTEVPEFESSSKVCQLFNEQPYRSSFTCFKHASNRIQNYGR